MTYGKKIYIEWETARKLKKVKFFTVLQTIYAQR